MAGHLAIARKGLTRSARAFLLHADLEFLKFARSARAVRRRRRPQVHRDRYGPQATEIKAVLVNDEDNQM
ncbi:hypothetical protein PV677_35960 [Streptomyces sp. DE06-01C]|uniref:hypothetical protein n=1 Tax=Streptomyces sp. DE06-01C TaxID=3028656 RepID=UPI0029C442FA|nr:hypothetical protein [Streptomyces sp. DE06-01C]MDX5526066.1 hypothetical protein [Streptomyces sp. DE06-01C]